MCELHVVSVVTAVSVGVWPQGKPGEPVVQYRPRSIWRGDLMQNWCEPQGHEEFIQSMLSSVCACSTPQQIGLFSWSLSLWLTVSSSLPDVVLDSVCFTQRTNIKNSGLPNSFTDAVKEFKCFIELPGWEEKKPSFSMTLCNSSSPLNPFITTYYHWQIQITVRTHNKSLTRIWNWRLEHFFCLFQWLTLRELLLPVYLTAWTHSSLILYYLLYSYLITSIWMMYIYIFKLFINGYILW